jgi:hypothetical protein
LRYHWPFGRLDPDRSVPPDVVRAFADYHLGVEVVEISEYDHVCCWLERWPELRDCGFYRGGKPPT